MRARHSVRLRLAAWHTGVLTVLLSVFAIGAYQYLARTTRQRVDQSLADMARVFVSSWVLERAEHPELNAIAAAQDAMHAVRYQDRRVAIYDDEGALVAISDSQPLTPQLPLSVLERAARSPVGGTIAVAGPVGTLTTIGRSDGLVRAYAATQSVDGARFTLVVLRDLSVEEEVAETFLAWMLGVIPLALLLAGVGGYLLARASLRPVMTMVAQADRISASSLHSRLAVTNPHDELGQLAQVLNRLLHRLEDSFDRQRQFMADASHELRTPVAIVRSAADVTLGSGSATPGELRETLLVISSEGRRLTRIVDDLFLLARADAGALPLQRETIYLEEILTESARAARALAAGRDITVVYEPADESPFHGDAGLLMRLLMNLVDNAIKHTPRGGQVRLALASERLPSSTDASAAQRRGYHLTVGDTGGGVPEHLRGTLFERFVRGTVAGEPVPRASASGAGLGLAIAKWIAEAHGGILSLEATGPSGSRFAIWLPIR